MNATACHAPLTLQQLLAYLLNELTAADEHRIDEHLFACEHCSALFGDIVSMADAIRRIVGAGGVDAVLTAPFIHRLRDHGVRVREYQLSPGSEVLCTITPDDDLVVARLSASLNRVNRLDVLVRNPGQQVPDRLEDVPFDATAGEVVLTPQSAVLRMLDDAVQQVQLVAVDAAGERTLGTYTFNHTRYRP